RGSRGQSLLSRPREQGGVGGHRMDSQEISVQDRSSVSATRAGIVRTQRDHTHSPLTKAMTRAHDDGSAPHQAFRYATTPRLRISAHTFPILAAIVECTLVAVSIFAAGLIYQTLAFGKHPNSTFYFLAAVWLAAMFVFSSGFVRQYAIKQLLNYKELLRSLFWHWNSAYSLFVFALFMTHATDFYSRGTLLTQYIGGLAVAIVARLLLRTGVGHALAAGTLQGKRVVVVGEAGMVSETIRQLQRDGQGIRVVSVVVLTADPIGEDNVEDGASTGPVQLETRAAIETLQRTAQHMPLDDIVISLPWGATDRIQALIHGLATVPATIHL